MNLIRVCSVGLGQRSKIDSIKLASAQGGEADSFEFVGFDGGPLKETINRHRPHVYLVFDSSTNPKWRQELLACPLSIRRQCIEVSESEPGPQIADKIMGCYLDFLNDERFPDQPLVSVFTPAHNTKKKIYVPFNGLLEQTYPNWEWVVVDDSTDAGATFEHIEKCAEHDYRVQIHRANAHCGIIGEMKRRAASLSRGQILIELDHDDELTPNAIADCVAAFQAFPDAGFAYSDCAGIRPSDGSWQNYGDNWAMGYGPKIRFEFYKGRQIGIMPAPPLNSKTVRHIISAPNHFRAWRRDAYFAAGGHSPHVHVCDDFELFIRTFLSTRCVHVAKLGYIQYLDGESNTQYQRFGEIHRLVRYFRAHYDRQIHQRFLDLDIDDFCWNGEYGDLNKPNQMLTPYAQYEWPSVIDRLQEIPEIEMEDAIIVPATPKDAPAKLVRDFPINDDAKRQLTIIDDFYTDPMAVREFALKQEYLNAQSTPNKGQRTRRFLFAGLKERFEAILGKRIINWDDGPNGCFQVTVATNDRVFHCDEQAYAGAIYLTPDAPLDAGTSLIRSVKTKMPRPEKEADILNDFAWEDVAIAANIFNRLVLWNGRHAHCASKYFGTDLQTGRLAQLFFFQVAE